MLFGIEICISYPAVAVMSIILLTDSGKDMTFCIPTVIIHELGHIIAMLVLKTPPKSIKYKLFEIVIVDNNKNIRTTLQNVIISLSGPLLNIIFFLGISLLSLVFQNASIEIFSRINLCFALFNLLPVLNLDGGQTLFLLLQKLFSEKTSCIIIDVLTIIFVIPSAFFGVLLLMKSPYNFSLLAFSIFLTAEIVLKRRNYC